MGSVRLASTASSHSITFDRAFAPFGEMYNTVIGGTSNPAFAALTRDTISDEYDTPNRELHPNQGRWISPDPVGLATADPSNPQTWNRYAYVMNNPLALIDPLGLAPQATAGGCTWDSDTNTLNCPPVGSYLDLAFEGGAPGNLCVSLGLCTMPSPVLPPVDLNPPRLAANTATISARTLDQLNDYRATYK
jgi:RHS repeat-associated protein